MKILIVDDEEIVRLAISRAAKRRGHEVMEANDGVQGLLLWKQHPPDCVFLDVLMPGLNGPEVISQFGDPGQTKVILISAYTGEYDLEKARNLGADMFIPKPFQDILEVIRQSEELVGVR